MAGRIEGKVAGTTTTPRLADAVALHRTLDSIRAGAH